MWLAGSLLLNFRPLAVMTAFEDLVAERHSTQCWGDSPYFYPGPGDTEESRQSVFEYLRVAEKGGSDVRLDVVLPCRPKAWPRAGLNAALWSWKGRSCTAILWLRGSRDTSTCLSSERRSTPSSGGAGDRISAECDSYPGGLAGV